MVRLFCFSLILLFFSTRVCSKDIVDINETLTDEYYNYEQINDTTEKHIASSINYIADINKTIRIANNTSDIKEKANIYKRISLFYYSKDEYDKAFKFFFKSLGYYEDIVDKSNIALCYMYLGNLYGKLGNYNQSLEYFKKSLAVNNEIDNNKGIASAYTNIGNIYFYWGNYPLAIDFYNNSLSICDKINNKKGEAQAYCNLAVVYKALQEYNTTIKYYKKSIILFSEVKDTIGTAIIYNNLGDVFIYQKEYDFALENINKSIRIAKDKNNKSILQNAYYNLSIINKNTGNYFEAFKYYQLSSEYKDSLFNEKKHTQIIEIQTKYELDKKEKEKLLSIQKNKILQQEKEIIAHRYYFLIGILLLVSIGSISIYIVLVNRIRKKKDLINKNNEISEANKKVMEAKFHNSQLEKNRLEDELIFKNKSLQAFALFKAQKDDLLNTLLDEINNTEDDLIEKKNIKDFIHNAIRLDRTQKEIDTYINQENQSFLYKLNINFPSLTENDNKLIVLLYLGMSSKDISVLLNITPKSVNMNRYRIRKKLKLNNDEDLMKFLKKI